MKMRGPERKKNNKYNREEEAEIEEEIRREGREISSLTDM